MVSVYVTLFLLDPLKIKKFLYKYLKRNCNALLEHCEMFLAVSLNL